MTHRYMLLVVALLLSASALMVVLVPWSLCWLVGVSDGPPGWLLVLASVVTSASRISLIEVASL